jgi:microcystin-dependent protein
MSDGYPVGAITAFAGAIGDNGGVSLSECWLLCDGAPLSIDDAAFAQLFDVIGYNYGGSVEEGIFRLPDYRGRFMRGADRGAGVDPDACRRHHHADERPRPDGSMAEPSGDTVGSIQKSATARPHEAFTACLSHLPQRGMTTGIPIGEPPKTATWNDGSRTVDTCTAGGDAESRPVNAYVNYFIKCADPSDR